MKSNGWRTALEIVIVVLQTVLVALGADLKVTMTDIDRRTTALEIARAESNAIVWTRNEQRLHEVQVAEVLLEIKLSLGKISNKVGVN